MTVNGEEITTTPAHPFYVPEKGWTSAIELRAGDILVLVNGEYVTVEAVQHEILESPITVYNFQVADFHTYYVGEQSVLVHNQNNDTTCGMSRNRTEAFNEAKDLAGVPRSQQPDSQWIVGGDITRKTNGASGYSNYVYSSDSGSHGRYYQYDTPNGVRVVVDHTGDTSQGLHMHAGMPKGDNSSHTYDFKTNRYQKITDSEGEHHIRYTEDN